MTSLFYTQISNTLPNKVLAGSLHSFLFISRNEVDACLDVWITLDEVRELITISIVHLRQNNEYMTLAITPTGETRDFYV